MVKTPLFPDYDKTVAFLKVLEGKPVESYRSLWATIWSLTGTPQNPVDWQNPDEWIEERLNGEDRQLAMLIWKDTNGLVNPRHTQGSVFLINNYDLVDVESDVFKFTARTKEFVKSEDNPVAREIDQSEGCIFLLDAVSLHKSGKRSTFLDAWKEYLESNSNYRQISVIQDSMRRRLRNMTKRGYVSREGNTYSITSKGTAYLDSFAKNANLEVKAEIKLSRDVEKFNAEQKEKLKRFLDEIDPYLFEHVIRELLSAMDYEEVAVTSPSNDKGVDVTGISQHGITTVKEVIQVKRNRNNIGRPILDGLRGSLHRFDAFQGTIITTSDFAKGAKEAAFEKGAAPITLINGDKLIDLLIKYGIGIETKTYKTHQFNPGYFETLKDQSGE